MNRLNALLTTVAVLVVANPAFAQDANLKNADNLGLVAIGAALAIGLAALGGAMGQGRAAAAGVGQVRLYAAARGQLPAGRRQRRRQGRHL